MPIVKSRIPVAVIIFWVFFVFGFDIFVGSCVCFVCYLFGWIFEFGF